MDVLYGDPQKFEVDERTYHLDHLHTLHKMYHQCRQAQARSDKRKTRNYNKTKFPVEFPIGSLVLLWVPPRQKRGQTPKLLAKYTGPHEVTRKESRLNYTIKDTKTGKLQTVHVQRLIRFFPYEPNTNKNDTIGTASRPKVGGMGEKAGQTGQLVQKVPSPQPRSAAQKTTDKKKPVGFSQEH